jgi:hypothetical protein
MKASWHWVWICLVLGLLLLGGGLVVPAHLRAVDSSVVLSAGRQGQSVLDRGQALLDTGRLGSAQLFVAAARLAEMPGWDRLGEAVTNRLAKNPEALYWGNDTRTRSLFNSRTEGTPFSGFIIRRENREAALARLDQSVSFEVQELLRCRTLNHTVLFPPSSSVQGQAFDAVLAECGLLLDGSYLNPALGGQIKELAWQANQGGGSQPLEQALLDLGSLGEHLNWDQLTAFVSKIPDADTLHRLAGLVDGAGERLPLWFVAVQLSGQPSAVARYAASFPQTGPRDISAALWYGENGVNELTQSGRRFYTSNALRILAAHSPLGGLYYFAAARSLQHPWLVLAAKWLCYLGAGFLFAAALHFCRPPVSRLELPLQVRGFHLLREFLFSLGFLLVVLLLSEPFLAQDSQEGGLSLRLHPLMAGGAIPAGIAGPKQTVMNPTILLTLLVFFVLQALIYVSCLVKLAEIRRQQVPPRMKLKLLENEDHLFDAGLYLGFVGTIVSLIFASLGLVKFSLMAAYSSTCFGIIFVVIFKIFHLRPARRKLLLEAEIAEVTATRPAAPAAVPAPALTS